MDPRIREHAEILVTHCTDIQPGDNVLVAVPDVAADLAVAINERLGEIGAHPMSLRGSGRAHRAYMRGVDPEALETQTHRLAAMEETDAAILVGGARNTHETGDVDPETRAAFARAYDSILEARLDARWVITRYPAPGDAQQAEMSTAAYEDFVWGAVTKDWAAQREFQAQFVDLLDPAEEVRIVAGDTTDLRMRVDGMRAVNEYGSNNMPGGEVFTCPIPDSVEGEVVFDMPVVTQGREVRGARLRFEDGEVVDHGAARNEDVLTSVLNTDEGARRVGELGIGMNRDIDRFTSNILFDEKMGDTVHLAVGKAIEEAVPEGQPFNESAVHLDMLVDMSEDARIEVDGEVVQRDGTFVFEEG